MKELSHLDHREILNALRLSLSGGEKERAEALSVYRHYSAYTFAPHAESDAPTESSSSPDTAVSTSGYLSWSALSPHDQMCIRATYPRVDLSRFLWNYSASGYWNCIPVPTLSP